MSYYREFEPFMKEIMEYGAGFGLIANSFSSLLSIAVYVLTAFSMYTIAKRRGIKNAWLSWIPVVNCWIIGSLSDQYRYVVKGEVKNKRKVLLTLNIANAVLAVIMVVVVAVMVIGAIGSAVGARGEAEIVSQVLGAVFGALAVCIPMAGVSIAIAVVRYMAMYDIYTSCSPQNNVLFLVLSIVFHVTEPFFLFFVRSRDEGMPPRKQEPVYTAPQEPWNQAEYL